jgi:enterochelin esterase family protein
MVSNGQPVKPTLRPTSPEIHPDRQVTFRLRALNAKEVKVTGELGIGTQAMTRNEGGIWSVTLGPLAPELYGYSLVVDGLTIPDPGNVRLKPQRSPTTSILEIPGNPPLLHDFWDVPHGTVRLHQYRSSSLGVVRRLRVYTPPGYDQHPQTRYPVLYLFHGSGDNEATWTELGRAHLILDNLISQKKAKPMLIVMPDGHAVPPSSGGRGRSFEAFELDLLESVQPFVEVNYRTRVDRLGRAIIGLSMGGMQSMTIGLSHLDHFAWVGGMSAFIPEGEGRVATALDNPKVNDKLKLFWVAIGKDDFLLKQMERTETLLKQKKIKHTYRVTEGNHSWPVWRRYLSEFVPLVFTDA